MKKLFYSLILTQIFLLFGGANHLSASDSQDYTHVFEITTKLPLPVIQGHFESANRACFVQAPTPNESDNVFFDCVFSGYEEETEETNNYKKLLESSNFLVILTWAKAIEPFYAIQINSTTHSTSSKDNLTESPRYIVFQVFRI